MTKTILAMILPVLLLASCTRDRLDDGGATTKTPVEKRNLPCLVPGAVYEGQIRIKVEPQTAALLEPAALASAAAPALSGVGTMDAALNELGAFRLERVFRHAGKYEERHRKAGLHLWYTVVFDESIDIMTAANHLAEIDGITLIEGIPVVERIDGKQEPVVATAQQIAAMGANNSIEPAAVQIYNDPQLSQQWHYYNDGSKSGFLTGADANVLRAWEIESGKSEVIVAVVDGGIDYLHEDLKANMWVNEAEKNGAEGVDDDDNGYVDDIYGYNFVTDEGEIVPERHGTHVAGTVAAVNNNGTGVGGVAGGDGSPGSGVKMISCQTFQTISGAEKPTNNFPAAIVYGADNGAVISQNSWGSVNLEPLSEAEAAAIQYFIDNAGIDKETGLQTGPMKGGIVIFAAGNLGNSGHYMPGAYESCFAVAAMGPAFRIASYSNYGSYVEITAPGGDKNYGTDGQVYSTLPGNLYGWLQGTSMACPHVSGIAALAISKYGVGSPGFTPVQLRELLLASANDIYPYNRNYSGQLGTGYIDAYKVLAGTGGAAPQPVSDLEAKWTFEGAYLSWSVTSDPDSGKASRYDILWSESNLDGIDFDDPPAGTRKTIVRVNDAAVGGKLATRLKGMESGKSYYISIAAVDYDGNRSAAYTVSGAPQSNNYPPEILGIPEEIILNTAEYREVPIEVLDMEGYDWTYSMTAGSSALNIRKDNGEGLTLVFDCIKASPGNYTATIGITDHRGDKTEAVIPYTIKPNNAPEATGVSEFVLHNVDEPGTFDLTRLFTDKDNDVLKYEVKLADMLFAEISYSESTLTAKALKIGTSRLTVTARDPRGLSAETAVMLVCRDAKRTADIYPVPVKKDGVLNIRMGKDVEGTIDVALFNTSGGGSVFEQTVAISPSAPATVNISSLRAGTYKIVVRYGETEISKTIAKL